MKWKGDEKKGWVKMKNLWYGKLKRLEHQKNDHQPPTAHGHT